MSTRALVLLGTTLAAACGATVAGPSWREPPPKIERTPTAEFTPVGQPSARYNDPGPAGNPTRLEQKILDAVAGAAVEAKVPPPQADPRLSAVAAELAAVATGEGPPPYDAQEFALWHHGIIEPSPYLLIVEMRGHDEDGVVGEFRRKVADMIGTSHVSRAGVGLSQGPTGTTTIVLALQESAIVTEAFARELPRGGALSLRGRVLAPFSDPTVYVTGPDGKVTTLPLLRDGAMGFRADVRCGAADGRMKIEIVGEDRSRSSTVLANFPVYCGAPAPRALALRMPAPDRPGADANEIEKRVFELLNQDRQANGLPPLAWDDRAARAARAHCEEMRDKGYVAHVSPITGGPSDRAHKAGIATPLVLENLARAYSAAETEQGLMGSPGHRANILSTQATHVGIGVAPGQTVGQQRELYVTQLFFRVSPALDREEARKRVVQGFLAARGKAALPGMIEDATLDGIAGEYAGGLALGKEPKDTLSRRANERLDTLARRFGSVMTVVAVTADPETPLQDVTVEPAAQTFGVGVAQGKHAELGEGALYVVIFLARNR